MSHIDPSSPDSQSFVEQLKDNVHWLVAMLTLILGWVWNHTVSRIKAVENKTIELENRTTDIAARKVDQEAMIQALATLGTTITDRIDANNEMLMTRIDSNIAAVSQRIDALHDAR